MPRMRIVNVIPKLMSKEIDFDAQPSIAVNPANLNEMAITTQGTPPADQKGPIFYSCDGGETWELRYDIPDGGNGDESPCFALTSSELYIGSLPVSEQALIMEVLRVRDSPQKPEAPQIITKLGSVTATAGSPSLEFDQPWAVATTVVDGPGDGVDRLYLGYNLHTGEAQRATVGVYLDASAPEPASRPIDLDPRTPRNGYEIRPAVHQDGTVYVAYKGVVSSQHVFNRVVNVVVARDDHWGAGQHPFTDLVGSDGQPGMVVAADVDMNEFLNDGMIGGVRLANDLAIAVDPNDSDVVYLAWGDTPTGVYTLHVRRSTDRGQNWSGDLLSVENAVLACLAINNRGTVAFLYQQLVDGRMETHFRTTTDGKNWDDTLMARTWACPPQTHAGDFCHMLAVGANFYGTFPAMNESDPANFFPYGGGDFRYQRNTFGGLLVGLDGSQVIAPSIDPFFFKVLED